MKERYNPDYIHHQNSKIANSIRDIVFGVEDGMVSTLGTITGIAVGSQDHSTVLLAGMVIISVESISMGIGSYISNLSEQDILKRKLYEEKKEIEDFPHEEKKELVDIKVEVADAIAVLKFKNSKGSSSYIFNLPYPSLLLKNLLPSVAIQIILLCFIKVFS